MRFRFFSCHIKMYAAAAFHPSTFGKVLWVNPIAYAVNRFAVMNADAMICTNHFDNVNKLCAAFTPKR